MTEEVDAEVNEKSVIWLAMQKFELFKAAISRRVNADEASRVYSADIQQTQEAADQAIMRLAEDNYENPLDRAEDMESLQDVCRLAAASHILKRAIRNMGEVRETIALHGPNASVMEKESEAAFQEAIAYSYGAWRSLDNRRTFRKSFSCREDAEDVQQLMRQAYRAVSWDSDDREILRQITLEQKDGYRFEVVIPADIFISIVEPEGEYFARGGKHR